MDTGKKTLRVNLTTGDIRLEAIDEKDIEAFIGGAGPGAEILRREIPEKIDPLSPENLVIFATGPFQGPSVPGGAKLSVVGISPQTGTYADTAAGADWGCPGIRSIAHSKNNKSICLQPCYSQHFFFAVTTPKPSSNRVTGSRARPWQKPAAIAMII